MHSRCISGSCRFPRQLPPKPTKAMLAANACGPVEGKRGETSRLASLLRRASWTWCIFPPSANHLLHGPRPGRPSFRRGKATGLGLLIGSEEDHCSLQREEASTIVAGKY